MDTLQIIIGSTRPGRVGLKVGEWFYDLAKTQQLFSVELLDLAEINLPFMDEPNHPRLHRYTKQHTIQWSEIITRGDAYIFITPEYNYGIPAPLKNAVDFLYQEWVAKPLSFISYGGMAGGARSTQMMKQVVTTLNMVPIADTIHIPYITKHIANGKFLSDDHINKATISMLRKLAVWSKYGKEIRKELALIT